MSIRSPQRPFVWDEDEARTQNDATHNLITTADEYNISILFVSGENFVSHCDDNGLNPEKFTVSEFNQWMDAVSDRMKEIQIQIESEEFKKIISNKKA